MGGPKDKQRGPERTDPADEPLDFEPDERKRSGRASFDERGNAVWEWQLETGVYSRDVNTQRLRKLELDELSIAETGAHPQLSPGAKPPAKPALPGGGFNPYDNSPQGKREPEGSNPYDAARNLGNALRPKSPAPAPAAPPRKPTDLRKLSDWIKLRRQVQEGGGEDEGGGEK